MRTLRSTAFLTIMFAAIFFLFTLVFPGPDVEPLYAGAAAGIFGIFLGFSISGANGRLNQVNELLKTENGYNLIYYKMSRQFGAKTQREVQSLVDNYLMAQIDYRLEDFDRSDTEFDELYQYLSDIEFSNDKEARLYTETMANLNRQTINRSQIETAVEQRISGYEWTSIVFLLVLVVFTSYSMSDGTLLRTIFVTILATASVLLVLVLRDMNDLKWDKDVWTWQPLKKLFRDLDLVPYLPSDALHEISFEKGEQYRTGVFPVDIDDFDSRKIELRTFGAKKK